MSEKRLNLKIQADLHRRLKMAAITDGVSMQAFVIAAIQAKLDRTPKP